MPGIQSLAAPAAYARCPIPERWIPEKRASGAARAKVRTPNTTSLDPRQPRLDAWVRMLESRVITAGQHAHSSLPVGRSKRFPRPFMALRSRVQAFPDRSTRLGGPARLAIKDREPTFQVTGSKQDGPAIELRAPGMQAYKSDFLPDRAWSASHTTRPYDAVSLRACGGLGPSPGATTPESCVNGSRGRKAEARPLARALGGEERLEQVLARPGRDAGARIFRDQPHPFAFGLRPQGDGSRLAAPSIASTAFWIQLKNT
jgi:hypothetical protein